MTEKVKGLTVFSVLTNITALLGFIAANEFGIKELIQAYEWYFYFVCALSVIAMFGLKYIDYQYTKTRYQFELIMCVILGFMLAYYGYFVCATVLTFCNLVITGVAYRDGDKK